MQEYSVIRAEEIQASLEALPTQGKRMLPPFDTLEKAPLRILEDHMTTNRAEVHLHEGDLWQCLEGEVQFICGGKLLNEKVSTRNQMEITGSGIEGGEKIVLCAGDWLWIEAGVPHQHAAEETARLIFIKIPKTL